MLKPGLAKRRALFPEGRGLGVGGRKRVKVKAHGLRSMGLFFLLADEDAAGVSWVAAVEGEQQIQSWEVKDINLRAAAWASAGKNVCKAIAVAIVDSNASATGKVFCVGIKLCK